MLPGVDLSTRTASLSPGNHRCWRDRDWARMAGVSLPPWDSPGRSGRRGAAAPLPVVGASQSNPRRSCHQRSFRPKSRYLACSPSRIASATRCFALRSRSTRGPFPRCGHHPSRRLGRREAAGYRLRIRRHLEQRDFDRCGYFPGIRLQTAPSLV